MITLGFDTATRASAVGLRLADASTLQARDDPAADEHPGHATRLLAMTHELLARAGMAWGALERIAVGVGPGRFTGLRVGIATARGLAQSLSLELVGVSTLRALAEPALRAGGEEHERVLAVIDARRGEVFAAAYARADHAAVDEPAFRRPLRPQQIGGVIARADGGGAEGARWLAVGDGAVRFRAHLEEVGVTVAADSSPFHLVGAGAICDLGAVAPAVARYEETVPDYRRRPDAERGRGRGRARARVTELQGARS